jgi:hypothetical protein
MRRADGPCRCRCASVLRGRSARAGAPRTPAGLASFMSSATMTRTLLPAPTYLMPDFLSDRFMAQRRAVDELAPFVARLHSGIHGEVLKHVLTQELREAYEEVREVPEALVSIASPSVRFYRQEGFFAAQASLSDAQLAEQALRRGAVDLIRDAKDVQDWSLLAADSQRVWIGLTYTTPDYREILRRWAALWSPALRVEISVEQSESEVELILRQGAEEYRSGPLRQERAGPPGRASTRAVLKGPRRGPYLFDL